MGHIIEGLEHGLEKIELDSIATKCSHENNDNYKSCCHRSGFIERISSLKGALFQ